MKYKIILASNSPRRKELLSGLDIDYEVRIIDGIEEEYPVDMPVEDIPQYLAVRKSIPYKATLSDNELLITADTVVVCEGKVLGKPVDRQDAVEMLRLLSGKSHYVVTGVSRKNKYKFPSWTYWIEATGTGTVLTIGDSNSTLPAVA